jgi:hypothetical protein
MIKNKIKIYVLLLAFLSIFLFSGCVGGNVAVMPTREDGALDVNIQDYTGDIQSFFLIEVLQVSNLTATINKGANTADLANSSNCVAFQAINIYSPNNMYQGIITDKVGSTISFTPSIDTEYNIADSYVYCGNWNMAVDGSTTPRIFSIHAPAGENYDLTSSVIGIIDDKDMDYSTFGSLPALSGGFVNRVVDGYTKNLFLIYNNLGFKLRGYESSYITKAPSGKYGITSKILYNEVYGAIPRIKGATKDTYQAVIQDDLTGLDELVQTVHGHKTTD